MGSPVFQTGALSREEPDKNMQYDTGKYCVFYPLVGQGIF